MTDSPARPLRIVVLGGGTAGWMAASLMQGRWGGRGFEISVLESPDIGIIGVGEGSTPQLKAFFDSLGIAESDWMPRCNATYKAGIEFRGWSDRPGAASYFHPFPNEIDERTAPAFFFNATVRRRGADVPAHPDRFFLASLLAQRKLAPLPGYSFPFRSWYGYHFDSALIGRFLREHQVARGVRHIEGTVARVEQADNGDIAALHTTDGRRIEGDFFVDSTGFRSLLLQDTLGVRFNSFGENLFNDSAVVVQTPADTDGIVPQTTSTALSCGWAWRIPLQTRVGNGYVYSSRYIDKDAAEAELRAHIGLAADHPPLRHLSMKVGRVEQHWARNCLGVGLSQGFIEPLEATALHLVQATVEGFIEAFEAGGFGVAHRDACNAAINRRFDGVRDYIVCHFKLASRSDSAYWRDCAKNEVLPPNLRALMRTWYSGEDLNAEVQRLGIDGYYAPFSWQCIFAGYGMFPPPDKLIPASPKANRYDLALIDDFLGRCALNYRPHVDVLRELAGQA